jgi:hypothetical protein
VTRYSVTTILFLFGLFFFTIGVTDAQEVQLVDDFEGGGVRNQLGSRASAYVMAPSRIRIGRGAGRGPEAGGKALKISFDKKNIGGPYGQGGWCGYYSTVKKDKSGSPNDQSLYFDSRKYSYLTFYVRGEKSGENFMVGVADSEWEKIGDSLKSEEIGAYLPSGRVTTDWQKAMIPLEAFFLDHEKLSSISIAFESGCFAEGKSSGTVYIDDIIFE